MCWDPWHLSYDHSSLQECNYCRVLGCKLPPRTQEMTDISYVILSLVFFLMFAELVADLREAILQIAKHFDAIDPKKVT